MTRKIIRIRQENANIFSNSIAGSEITSAPFYDNPIWNYDEPSLSDAVGMVGLILPEGMSGNQAHKIIEGIKSNERDC